MKAWQFGIDNDKLVNLVLSGVKTATTSIYKNDSSVVGEESVLTFENEKKACIVKTKEVIITEFKNITPSFALLEGEGTFEEWKRNHIKYFKSIDPSFDEDTKVEFEIFEVVENLVLKRLNIAKTIVTANKTLFGDNPSIEEINAGFNNAIFNINNKYIIKICDNIKNEKLFDIEYNFYNLNKNNKSIPKLYKYDNSKSIVSYVYEIIEKISDKSMYYHWYKMDEEEREEFIKKLMQIMKNLHLKKYEPFDWCAEVKEEIIYNFNNNKDFFNTEEQNLINKTFKLYEQVLSNNVFSLIHNDLHFDNVLLDENNEIKIIDFNDSRIAPFDYEFRILYMCVKQPWKWANTEMDPYQKPKDYVNIFEYVKKYYKEINDLKYLEERMIIYSILNDIRHLSRFKNIELKEKIVDNSKLLLSKMIDM